MNNVKTLKDLYELLIPALNCKTRQLHDLNYTFINNEDIWKYLKENVWNDKTNLTLSDLVDDILNTDNDKLASYKASMLNYE